ncbi:MAG: hypothetical protein KAJ19_05985 [Gammaproteobacteria bacterium]|nr:hypothetical protein [Gammaproteobacteria bacterium]
MSDTLIGALSNFAGIAVLVLVMWLRMGDMVKAMDRIDHRIQAIWKSLSAHKDDNSIHVPVARVDRIESKIDSKVDKTA